MTSNLGPGGCKKVTKFQTQKFYDFCTISKKNQKGSQFVPPT